MSRDLFLGVVVPECSHRPEPGADPVDCGLWWHQGKGILWVNGQDWLGENGVALAQALSDMGLPGKVIRTAIGRAALTVFEKAFPGAAPAEGVVTVDVCCHENGKGVTV